MTRCRQFGCRRAPASASVAFCDEHLPSWVKRDEWKPAWRRWTEEHRQAKELAS